MAISIAFGILTVFVISARLFARIIVVKGMGLDDG